jgi:hypothetical protein
MSILTNNFADMVKTDFTFFRKTTSTNSMFEEEDVWSDTPNETVDGVLRQLSGGKRYVASIHGYDADFRFYCDAPADILPGDRLEYDGKRYQVKAVNNVMDADELLQIDLQWVSNDGTGQLQGGS